jgi:hypothetical protein
MPESDQLDLVVVDPGVGDQGLTGTFRNGAAQSGRVDASAGDDQDVVGEPGVIEHPQHRAPVEASDRWPDSAAGWGDVRQENASIQARARGPFTVKLPNRCPTPYPQSNEQPTIELRLKPDLRYSAISTIQQRRIQAGPVAVDEPARPGVRCHLVALQSAIGGRARASCATNDHM